MAGYTKRAWKIQFGRSDCRIIAGSIQVCNLERWRDGLMEEQEANAHLIAAALEMLEALRDLLKARWVVCVDWAPQSDYDSICANAEVAIAKAEGRA